MEKTKQALYQLRWMFLAIWLSCVTRLENMPYWYYQMSNAGAFITPILMATISLLLLPVTEQKKSRPDILDEMDKFEDLKGHALSQIKITRTKLKTVLTNMNRREYVDLIEKDIKIYIDEIENTQTEQELSEVMDFSKQTLSDEEE